MQESPLFWPAHMQDGVLHVLDETLIPSKEKYIAVKDLKGAVKVISGMKTRAFGQFLVVLNAFLLELNTSKDVVAHIKECAAALNNSRPTFPFADVTGIIVGVAQKTQAQGGDVKMAVAKTVDGFLASIRGRRLERVNAIAAELHDGDCVLTHCNVSGELAMAAAIALEKGVKVHFFATETRPYMQGAKLTAWELQRAGARVTLVPDNAAALLMAEARVNKVIIGSDRSAANGDVANKIGSYQIAVLAKEFGVPLIVLTQPSKSVAAGKDMPIEERSAEEVIMFNGKKIYPDTVKGFYPGFDVVPHTLITKSIAINAGL